MSHIQASILVKFYDVIDAFSLFMQVLLATLAKLEK